MRGLLIFILLAACHKSKAPDPVAAAEKTVADAIKDQALRDLQNDVILLRAQLSALTIPIGRANAALYTCDRLALAQKEVADDARAQALIGEADSLCAYKAPLAAAEARLSSTNEAKSDAKSDCGSIRDVVNRVGAKYRNDPQVTALVARFKSGCPKTKLFVVRSERSYAPSAPSQPDPRAQRDACKRRCDDAAFSCRGSCSYCYGCTTDKTQEWCTSTCNTCKQGCEQNEKFCQAQCGS
jgi:hypothetical protein